LSPQVIHPVAVPLCITGYGVRAPGDCWVTAYLVGAHSLLTLVLDSIVIGEVMWCSRFMWDRGGAVCDGGAQSGVLIRNASG
jgi:hypothetical protein